MWAGYLALVNQQRVADSKKTLGFLNAIAYPENVVAATYAADFHDITSGKSGTYSAEKGFDLVTGWGSPRPALITALAATP
jgi:kumamolisin